MRLTSATTLALAAATCAAQTYRLHMVPEPPILGTSSVQDMNNFHQAVGSAVREWNDGGVIRVSNRAFRWTVATGLVLDTDYSAYLAINDHGDVVSGEAIFLGAKGEVIEIPDVPGFGGWPTIEAMNNARQVVGYSGGTRCHGHFNDRNEEALLWSPATGTLSLVDDFGVPDAAEARDINEFGQIAGIRSERRQCSNYQAFALDTTTGVWTDLHDMLTGGQLSATEATAINDLGQVVGEGGDYVDGSAQYRAWIYTPGQGFTFLPGLNGGLAMDIHPMGVNNHGVVVGRALDGNFDWRAFIWDAKNGMRDLNDLVIDDDWVLSEAWGITDDGWIHGSRHTPIMISPVTGFVVRPIPKLGAFSRP